MENQLKLGFAPTRRDIFSKEDAKKQKEKILARLNEWQIDFVDIEWLNDEGLLYDNRDVFKVAKYFKDHSVDALFIPHCNFGDESCVAELSKTLGVPVLLWGPRDEMPLQNGERLRDSQCGMFATSKVLQRFGVRFSYIENSSVDAPVFKEDLLKFLRAANVVRAYKTMRIGQIGTRPESFLSVIYNEGALLEKHGIGVTAISILDFVNAVKKLINARDPRLEAETEKTKKYLGENILPEEFLINHAAIKCALRDFLISRNLSAVAFQCWNSLQSELKIMPCLAMAELSDESISVVCETDVMGAVTAALMKAARATEEPLFFSDLTIRHPTNENAELLWHCGPFPISLKKPGTKAFVGEHWTLKNGCVGSCEWELKDGNVVFGRLDESGGKYKFLLAKGKTCDGPFNRGTYVWVEYPDWPVLERKVMYGPYIHHVACLYEDVIPVLKEAVRFLDGDIELDIVE